MSGQPPVASSAFSGSSSESGCDLADTHGPCVLRRQIGSLHPQLRDLAEVGDERLGTDDFAGHRLSQRRPDLVTREVPKTHIELCAEDVPRRKEGYGSSGCAPSRN